VVEWLKMVLVSVQGYLARSPVCWRTRHTGGNGRWRTPAACPHAAGATLVESHSVIKHGSVELWTIVMTIYCMTSPENWINVS